VSQHRRSVTPQALSLPSCLRSLLNRSRAPTPRSHQPQKPRQHCKLHRVTELFRRVKGTVSPSYTLREAAEVAARTPAALACAPFVKVWFEDRIPRVERTLHPSGLTPTHRILHAGRIRSPGRLTHVFCQVFLSAWYLYDVASLHMIRPGLNTRTSLSWAPTTDLWPDVETLSVLHIC
jgi:hypothetical protein